MYISLWENSRGHPDNDSFMQFSTKIDGFELKYSQGFENSYNSHEQYPLEKFFIFNHLPKLYFGFKLSKLCFTATKVDYPPCIRMIVVRSESMKLGALSVVTCTGGTIGR